MTITMQATEHTTPHEAIQHCDVSRDDVAFSVGGRVFSATRQEFERVQHQGVQPTTWHDRDGRLFSVPGRNG